MKAAVPLWHDRGCSILQGRTMLDNATFAASTLGVRPATAIDAPFLEMLYRAARPDLQLLDGTPEQVGALMAQQYEVLQAGTGGNFPNALHFVIEKVAERIGGLIVDFGANEIRLVYLALLPAVRGRGYGREVLQGLQQAAARARAPLAVTVWRSNPGARQLYLSLGFRVEDAQPTAERLVWYPDARPQIVVS